MAEIQLLSKVINAGGEGDTLTVSDEEAVNFLYKTRSVIIPNNQKPKNTGKSKSKKEGETLVNQQVDNKDKPKKQGTKEKSEPSES